MAHPGPAARAIPDTGATENRQGRPPFAMPHQATPDGPRGIRVARVPVLQPSAHRAGNGFRPLAAIPEVHGKSASMRRRTKYKLYKFLKHGLFTVTGTLLAIALIISLVTCVDKGSRISHPASDQGTN